MSQPTPIEKTSAAGVSGDAMTSELRSQLKVLIIQCCQIENVTPAQVGDDAMLFGTEPLHLTSLDAVEIAVALEYRFGVELKNASSLREPFASIAKMAEYLERTADPAKLRAALNAGLVA